MVDFPIKPYPGIFLERLNRFVAVVLIKDQKQLAHLPNSGRLQELLKPGTQVFLWKRSGEERKTQYELALVKVDDLLVSLDSRLPNYLLKEAIMGNRVAAFDAALEIQTEKTFGQSRIDLLVKGKTEQCLVEVKSVTLVENGIAKFPDAPTARGKKHLRELVKAKEAGYRSVIVFMIQREDAHKFTPNDAADPEFGSTLRWAYSRQVEIHAYDCRVRINGITVRKELPVEL